MPSFQRAEEKRARRRDCGRSERREELESVAFDSQKVLKKKRGKKKTSRPRENPQKPFFFFSLSFASFPFFHSPAPVLCHSKACKEIIASPRLYPSFPTILGEQLAKEKARSGFAPRLFFFC